MLIIARYLESITFENKSSSVPVFKLESLSAPATKQQNNKNIIIAETYFAECNQRDIQFIADCIKHGTNADTIFKRSRSMAVNGEEISGIIRWNKDDVNGHSVIIKYKNKYYTNIEPIWPDNITATVKEPEFSIGDLVKIRLSKKTGIIQRYVGNGYYDVKIGSGDRWKNGTEKLHITSFI